ncbi:DNA polymerase III subunit chi [Hydrogenophaga crassostreae]|nr:DNA polymerase III subunit chi [Hydrogenophaga crassostreae]
MKLRSPMTEVAFHVNVPDLLGYACRLIRKGYLLGMSMLVVGDARQVALLNKQLWSMRSVDFVPHCLGSEEHATVVRSAVVLTDDEAQGQARGFDVLVNLSGNMPSAYASFDKIFEVVSVADADLEAARQRWRAYLQAGLAPKRHEIQP